MRNLTIAVGKSRKSKTWHNKEVSWEWLRDRLRSATETSESASEYKAMSRDRQSEIKDVGGFVGGYLRDGLRKAANIESRSVVTLDYDEFDAEHLGELETALQGLRWALHSTHKHTESAWRVRVVIPADRDMTPDEYGAVSRKLGEKIGFSGIDRSTFQPERLMFWGSHSKGAPYLFREGTGGEYLNVDKILGEYRDWRDMSAWPLVPEEEAAGLFTAAGEGGTPNNDRPEYAAILRAAGALKGAGRYGKQEDPIQKKGLVGTFCRCYDIEGAIERFLPEVYRKCGVCHYTYTGGTTSGGAWVADGGKFLYSYHSTDPINGKLVNSWDLVRLHKFHDADLGCEEKQSDRLPSYKLMEELAMSDESVRLRLMDERRQKALSDFGDIDLTEAPAIGGDRESMSPEEAEAWKKWDKVRAHKLVPNKQGELKTNAENLMTVLEGDPRLSGKLMLDEFSGKIMVKGKMPWKHRGNTWSNNDYSNLRVFLDREYGLSGKEKVKDSLVSVAVKHGYHPVKRYLDSLEWDGEKRLGRLFTDVLGAEDTELNRALCELLFVAAVRRIRKPGEKFDYFMILHGPEGCGKSSLFSLMGGEWFTDSVVTIEGKEGMESIQGKWIIEMGELTGVRKSEVESQKRFISSQVDSYRPAYGEVTEDKPRQCVMVGTTNEDLFLRGILSTNRRSPVVEIKPELRKVEESVREYVGKWRDQLWAEASELEKDGKPLYLGDRFTQEIRRIQDEHNLDKSNPLFPEIDRFLDYYLPANWESLDYDSRMAWYRAQTDPGELTYLSGNRREYITVAEILRELFELKRTDKDYVAQARKIGQYLNSKSDEWQFKGPVRTKAYGVQKAWQRCNRGVTECNRSLSYTLGDL